MGYTHYWTFKEVNGKNLIKAEKQFKKAVKACQCVIKYYYKEFKGISGYSAHTKLGQYSGIEMNGKQDLGHETFYLRSTFKESIGFHFCKTARKPYDTLVVACLSILHYYLNEFIEIDSDGEASELQDGVDYVNKIVLTKCKFKGELERLVEPKIFKNPGGEK